MDALTPTVLANAVGISVPYASQILTSEVWKRTPSRALAIRIYRKLGRKLPPIEHLSDADIGELERIEAQAAA